ncbi:MAG TPA: DUF4159 domain-containing protein [Planctomycetota bacterium]|jgi:hypothetical protein
MLGPKTPDSRFQTSRLRLLGILLCALSGAYVFAGEPEHVTAEQVEEALKKGSQVALQNLENYRRTPNIGYTVVCVMALLNSGVPRDHHRVLEAIKRIVAEAEYCNDSYQGTYQCGLINMLLATLKDPAHARLAKRMTLQLQRFQNPDGGWGDYSRTQYALLGLKAAREMSIDIPPEVFKRAKRFMETGQNKDGSWAYTPAGGNGYGSMTTAGISSLFIANEQNYKESPVCGAAPNDDAMQSALRWLGEHFSVTENPCHNGYHFYYLYALERIGVLTGQRYIGGHDWYREGADYLVSTQAKDGSWPRGGTLGTEFALLFLGKGREPVVMQKLQYAGDWNCDPYDANDLAEQAGRDLKLPMTVQVVSTSAGLPGIAGAPILYLQGHKAFSFDPDTRAAIKGFLDQGGFVLACACCGSANFDKSFRSEMAAIFPDSAFERLPQNHPIYTGPHPIMQPAAVMVEGLNTGCRTSVLYAPHDLCCGWSGCKGCRDKDCISATIAKDLGVNMIAYALKFKKMDRKLDDPLVIGRAPSGTLQRSALVVGQLSHNGDWNPDPGSIPNLTQTLKESIGMKGSVEKRRVVLGVDDLGEFPLLYLTGHRAFEYTAGQIDALRTYLDRGGFLLSDPCCGQAEFDAAFRRLCKQLYPDKPLAVLPLSHVVLQQPYRIESITYKPAAQRLVPNLGAKPALEGISAPDGRLQVLYSRFNIGCELQGHPCLDCVGVSAPDAYHIAVNAVFYALSH